jgi:hypothetical protein
MSNRKRGDELEGFVPGVAFREPNPEQTAKQANRLEAFVRGVGFRERDLPVEQIVKILRTALYRGGIFTSEEQLDRALVRLAALSVAFWREAGEVLAGNFELDFRDEAILDAVVEYLSSLGE